MISDKLTLKEASKDDDMTTRHYTCSEQITLAGDSIWDCDLAQVTVTDICITEGVAGGDYASYKTINVYYTVDGEDAKEGSWRLYTDTGFADAISELLDDDVYYTEQGMQDDGMASME